MAAKAARGSRRTNPHSHNTAQSPAALPTGTAPQLLQRGRSMPSPPGHEPPLRVLVVDDNRDAADSLCLLASAWGHDPRAAYDGASALRVAAEHAPDVVFCNLGLPDMDAAALAGRLSPGPALVALTGYSDEAHR